MRGDCFRACIASIFELPLESVPHFVQDYTPGEWWAALQAWLAPRGLAAMWLRITPDELMFGYPCEDAFCILNGASPRGNGTRHSVVGKIADGWSFEIAYDPHPSGAGLEGQPDSALIFLPRRLP